MSDQAPDPIDKAYAQAEAVLDDEAARAARRARVLGAVARDAEASPAPAPSRPQNPWRRHGGWLAAASVAGVSLLVALQINPPADRRQAQPPASPPPVAAAPSPAPAPSIAEAPPEAGSTAPAPAITAQAAARSPREASDAAVAPPPPPAPSFEARLAPPPPPVAAAPSAPPAADRVEELVVSAGRIEAQQPAARAASGAMKASPASLTERLRAAAAAGRVGEVRALLAQGAPVDAPDDAGETALMKAVQGEHPAAAALLRRHGANLDLKNREGVTARDMAASIDDADLNRALGLAP